MKVNKQIVIYNLIWRFMERIGAQLVQFVVSVVLARIIAPEAYGTITLVLVFAQILQVFVDSGLGNALIQKKMRMIWIFRLYFSLIYFVVLAYMEFFFSMRRVLPNFIMIYL